MGEDGYLNKQQPTFELDQSNKVSIGTLIHDHSIQKSSNLPFYGFSASNHNYEILLAYFYPANDPAIHQYGKHSQLEVE